MHEIDLNKCKECTESRCILYNGIQGESIEERTERLFEEKVQQRIKELANEKRKQHWIQEKEYYNRMKEREAGLINYDRKPYMNESDWRHDENWFLAIQGLMRADEKYYNSIEY